MQANWQIPLGFISNSKKVNDLHINSRNIAAKYEEEYVTTGFLDNMHA